MTGLTSGAVAVSTAGFIAGHTCVLTSTGGVKCWGENAAGELGDGGACGPSCATPVDVVGLSSGASAVSAGDSHTCALTTMGGVRCWGSNSRGQLGNGTATDSSTPVDVSGLTSGIAAVSAGAAHTCALTVAGGAKCWGDNAAGELGNGSTTDSAVPADVSGLTTGVAAVYAGGSYQVGHTCAVTTAGGVKCWGDDSSGELGDGQRCAVVDACNIPVDVTGLASGVASGSAGVSLTCAVTTIGGVKCWGSNAAGSLGNGTIIGPQVCAGPSGSFACSTTPVDVVGLGPASPTPTASPAAAAATPPTATPAGAKPGDVDCSGSVGAMDAAGILEQGAGLLALPCPQNADVNGDGATNAIDALLVLQFSAGLLSRL